MSWIKKISFDKIDKASVQLEFELQTYIGYKYDFTPKTNSITYFKDSVEILMDLVKNGRTLAEHFSDEPDNIPKWVWDEIRKIIRILYYQEGIEYIDITPYNFMIDSNNKIWIIDFGHAYYTDISKPMNWFLSEFIYDELNSFNPDFK